MALKLAGNVKRLTEEEKQFVEKNIKLAYKLAYNYASTRKFDVDDAKQTAIFGLMRAAQKYDPSLGFTFSSYAKWWIYYLIDRYCDSNFMPYKQSAWADQAKSFLNKKIAIYINEHSGEKPDDETQIKWLMKDFTRKRVSLETAKLLIMPIFKFSLDASAYETSYEYLSFRNPGPISSGKTYNEILSDSHEPSIEDEYDTKEKLAYIEKAMNNLNDIEKFVVIRRNGLMNTKKLSVTEIGKHFNFSKQRASEIEKTAMSKIKKYVSFYIKREKVWL